MTAIQNRIQLAVNYSKESEELLHAGRIRFDLFKLPDWPDLVDRICPTFPSYVHFTLSAGCGSLANVDWGLIEKLRNQTGTPYVNLHLLAPPELDPNDPAQAQAVVEQAMADIRLAGEQVGVAQVIVENVPLGASEMHLRPMVDPYAIARIVRETGCGMLLDIGHARRAAHTLGMDECTYLQALPVERLREIHLTGVHSRNGRLIDHMSLLPADWALLDWALEKIQAGQWTTPGMLAFEYGGLGEPFAWRSEASVLAEQVPEIYRRLF